MANPHWLRLLISEAKVPWRFPDIVYVSKNGKGTKMKTLMTLIILVVATACGSSVDHLATSIDNATAAANTASTASTAPKTPNTAPVAASGAGTTTVTVETKVTVSTGAVVAAVPVDQADALDGTAWSSSCDNGLSYTARFAKGVETLTTNVFPDEACQMVPVLYNQDLNYAIDGDNIQFNEAAAGQYTDGAPFETFEIDGNLLHMSGNPEQVMTRI